MLLDVVVLVIVAASGAGLAQSSSRVTITDDARDGGEQPKPK